jgi:general secretion pathway protein A
MYNSYFEFREKPFNVTPDPRFFYQNPVYRESYANLLTGIRERKGFVVMTGEVGTGKTTLLRLLMKNLEANVRFAYFYNTNLNFEELLTFACEELGLQVPKGGRLRKIQTLNEFLIDQLRRGGTAALLIDEAQHLTEHVLESLRLLSNLETGTEKLLQIVLVGQPELDVKLAQPSLRQLKQRVAISCSLDRLKDREVRAYIQFRLESVGCERKDLFHPAAIERIAIYSGGVPRLINIICDNALTIAFASSERRVTREMIDEVANDLKLNQTGPVTIAPAPVIVPAPPAPAPAAPAPPAPAPVASAPAAPAPSAPAPVVPAPPSAPVAPVVPVAPPVVETPRATVNPTPTAAVNPTSEPAVLRTPPRVRAEADDAPEAPSLRGRARWMIAALAIVAAGGAAVWQLDTITSVGAAAWERAQARSVAAVNYTIETWNAVRSQIEASTAKSERPTPSLGEPSRPSESAAAATTTTPVDKAPADKAPAEKTATAAPEPAASTPTAQWTPVAPAPAAAIKEERRVPETIPVSLPPRDGAVVIQRGGTVSSLAYHAYGRYDLLAIDMIKELNPHIDDLDWIRPGERLALPPLSAETLIRAQTGGGHRIVLASFLNAAPAEKLADQVRQRGYTPRIIRRQVTGRLTLYRVEIFDVTSRHAAEQAWKVVVANCLVLIEDTPCGGARHEDKP